MQGEQALQWMPLGQAPNRHTSGHRVTSMFRIFEFWLNLWPHLRGRLQLDSAIGSALESTNSPQPRQHQPERDWFIFCKPRGGKVRSEQYFLLYYSESYTSGQWYWLPLNYISFMKGNWNSKVLFPFCHYRKRVEKAFIHLQSISKNLSRWWRQPMWVPSEIIFLRMAFKHMHKRKTVRAARHLYKYHVLGVARQPKLLTSRVNRYREFDFFVFLGVFTR